MPEAIQDTQKRWRDAEALTGRTEGPRAWPSSRMLCGAPEAKATALRAALMVFLDELSTKLVAPDNVLRNCPDACRSAPFAGDWS